MNVVAEAIAWLERSRDSKSPSTTQVYATAVLAELTRLNEAHDFAVREGAKTERIWRESLAKSRALEKQLFELEHETRVGREVWDAERARLEGFVDEYRERISFLEENLKDIHYGLLHQPELTREQIAEVITTLVTPHEARA